MQFLYRRAARIIFSGSPSAAHLPQASWVRYGILATGLIVGLAEGARNVLVVNWTSAGAAGSLPQVLCLPAVLFTWIPAYRVLIVFVYYRTENLLMAILMRTSLIAFWYIFTPRIPAGAQLVA